MKRSRVEKSSTIFIKARVGTASLGDAGLESHRRRLNLIINAVITAPLFHHAGGSNRLASVPFAAEMALRG